MSNVGGTPVSAASPKAPATSTTRRFLGVVGDWWYKTRSTTPRVQTRDEDPGRVVNESVEPSLGDTPALAIYSKQNDPRSQLDSKFRENLQKMSGTRKAKDPAPLGTEALRDRGGRPPTPPPLGVLPAPQSMSEKPLNLTALAWYKNLKMMIDLTNQSEGFVDGAICAKNLKASSVMTLLPNLMYTTYANQQRECIVGNSRFKEMIAATNLKILGFQPPCMPTDWQAKQIASNIVPKLDSPFEVHLLADDTFDLGNRNMADAEPLSVENAGLANQLTVRTPLHLWEKSGILEGKIKFEDFRVITNLTLDRAVTEVRGYYAKEIRAVEQLGGENSTHGCACVDRIRIESGNRGGK